MQCRFNYPLNLCPQTKLVFEPVHRSDGKLPQFKAKIVTKRSDTRLNNHQRIQLQGWRATCDIQVMIDQYACIECLSKYAAKGEPKSPMLAETFDIVLKNTDNNSDAQINYEEKCNENTWRKISVHKKQCTCCYP